MCICILCDAQYTADLSSVSEPASHASRMLAGPGRMWHVPTRILGPWGGQVGGRAVCEEEASISSPPCSVVPEIGCL